MDDQTKLDVIIGGRKYTLEGFESEEYIQQLAWYLDKKITEAKRNKPMTGIIDVNSLYIIINIVDDLFKQRVIADDAVENAYKMNEELTQLNDLLKKMKDSYKSELDKINTNNKAIINELTEENASLKERLSNAIVNQNYHGVKLQ